MLKKTVYSLIHSVALIAIAAGAISAYEEGLIIGFGLEVLFWMYMGVLRSTSKEKRRAELRNRAVKSSQ